MKKLADGMDVRYLRSALRVVSGIVLATAIFALQWAASAQTSPPKELAAIPPNKDTDLKFYHADGTIQMGVEALEHMTSDADLVLWVAGNQFFAMDEVVGAFQQTHPGVTVGLITLPPGLILSAIQGGGWVYDGKEYRCAPDIYASVNLGHLRQLKAGGVMSKYAIYMHNELAATHLEPGRLDLEITETALLQDNEAVLEKLHQLKSYGLQISMDDFGTGYSSLSYLRSFPFDKIKIDQSFVRGLGKREDSLAIVRAVISLGKNLGMTITAEGVETDDQLGVLRQERCDEVQGFLFSPAVRLEETLKLLPKVRHTNKSVA